MTMRLGSDFVHFAPIERSMFVIGEEPGRDWSLAGLARLAGMSRSSYAAAFAQQVGEPPMHYVKRMRMTRAAEILRSTNLDAGAIAAQVGYKTDASLTRAFRRFFGLPPGQYRRRFWVEASEAG
jgi:transcriptional regulator GlxA family with amidase domain